MIVTKAELTNYMDIKLSLRQQDAADLILAGLQGELEAYLRRPVEQITFEEEYRLPSNQHGVPMGTFLSTNTSDFTSDSFTTNPVDSMIYAEPPKMIYLRNSPVIEILSVTVKPVHGVLRTLVVDDDYVAHRFGVEYFYGFENDLVTVTYTAGLDGNALPFLKLLILRAASREMQNLHDDVVGVKDLETRNVGPLVTGFLDTELASVSRYRRRRIA